MSEPTPLNVNPGVRAWRTALAASSFVGAAALVVGLLRLSNPGIPDPDSFYHYRHAAEYLRHGLLSSAFPWLPYTVLSRYASDMGYGFHLFLVPFALLRDPVMAMKLASVAETVIVMGIVYAVLQRRGVRYAAVWPFALVFVSPPIIWTVFQTRPQTLTMGFVALMLSAVVAGSAPGALLAGFLTSFIHLNAIAIVPVVVGVAALVKGVVERRWEWRVWVSAFAGVALGWLLRPNPLGAARIEYVQTVVHETARRQGLPLLFGREWLPVPPAALNSFLFFLTLWLAIAAAVIGAAALRRQRLAARDRTFLWSSLALSVVLFLGMMVVTKRLTPFWATAAVMFCAQGFACCLDPLRREEEQAFGTDGRVVAAFAAMAMLFAMVWTGVSEHVVQRKWRSIPPDRLKASAQWIRGRAAPGDIVFNVDWAMFPELFCWDPDRRYVGGLDPIFLYADDPARYWRVHHYQTGEASDRTWTSPSQSPGSAEDTFRVIRDDLDASYVVVAKARQSGLYQWLAGDPRFVLGYEDISFAVFAIAE